MNSMEIPLVLFTVLSQVAVGLSVFAAARQWQAKSGKTAVQSGTEWLVAGLLLLVALIASLFHLGHPLGGPRAILNLGSAWLSREILFVLLFGGGIIVTYLAYLKDAAVKQVAALLTAVLGILLLISTGLVYSAPGYPALNSGIPLFYSLLTAAVLGVGFFSYFASEDFQPLLTRILAGVLVIGLVVNLLIPSFWLSGGAIMQQSGAAYFGSALYWVQLVGEFGLGLVVIGITKSIPRWLPILLLLGELLGRLSMFYLTVHASTNIGGL